MTQRDADYAVLAAALVSGLYATISGLIADLFGFPQFFLHRYAGYVCAALIVLHLALNWRRTIAYLRRRIRKPERQERSTPLPREQAPPTGRRQLLVSILAAVGGFALGWLIPSRRLAELTDETTDIGAFYHQWSKPGYSQVLGVVLNWGQQPERYKTYANAERFVLPAPGGLAGLSLEETIEARRSVRNYAADPLPLTKLSYLLHATQGITESRRGFRAAPSAGALYPIELYAAVHNVTGLGSGIYHYAVRDHALALLQAGDFRTAVMQAGLWQDLLAQASVCFILSAIFQRTRWRYRERTYRYVMLEAGHIGQNLYLAATSMGLGACAVGAFLDDEFNELLGLDGQEEAVLYVISVGTV
jgi:SagB-type dehydrogenase family enzyme